MPIDLKWVRSDPDQVREWQTLRQCRARGDNDKDGVESVDLVDDVLGKDEVSRQHLQRLQEYKKLLKQVQVRLRPKKNAEQQQQQQQEENRETLLQEKKAVEAKIKLAESSWKASLEDTHKALCQLASPVTNTSDDAYDLDALQVTPFSIPISGHAKSSMGINLEQAWRRYTLNYFSDYLWVELPRGMPVASNSESESESDSAFMSLDRAEELWGSCLPTKPSSSNGHSTINMLPSWIRLFTEFLPNKSIWGEKELPRYTALWSSTSLELVAVMAPSVVDAREIQTKLVQELLVYYESLLANPKNALKRIVVSAPDLNHHERSRIEIHVVLSSDETQEKFQTLTLGWVSHWGDAATRAYDMAFSGGGVVQAGGKKKFGNRNASKEFVHLVEASVMDESTWKKILYANSTQSNSSSSDGNENQLVNVPPVLVPHLVRPIPNVSSILLKDLFLDEKSKRKKKESVFGVLGGNKIDASKAKKQEAVASGNGKIGVESTRTRNGPKFPPLGFSSCTPKEDLEKRIRLEKLSCPYDFLLE
eukprot:CAMPEP_0116142218 /NCGR_PEP_ID=MMETSP0329-20121206/14790_1 /TAXON_ID=697910 /ORGANISM="Pseudo-nitzschia arenysensis, Strain B593" /LENGTH=534 /DNA_ID=CAMNT_0003637437 /DNA_START=272 /DNA_END=1876 /DNA_ORIENTATION=+